MSLLLYFFYKPNILLWVFYPHWMCENVSLKSHILSSDFCHGCSWMGIYYFCLRLQISEHTIYAKPPGNSHVAHLKSTQGTRVTSVALHWQTLTWSVVDGMSWTVLWLYLPVYNNNYVIKYVTDNKIKVIIVDSQLSLEALHTFQILHNQSSCGLHNVQPKYCKNAIIHRHMNPSSILLQLIIFGRLLDLSL